MRVVSFQTATTTLQVVALTTAELASMTTLEVSAVKTAQLAALSTAQIAALSSAQIEVLRSEHIRALTTAKIDGLLKSQTSAFNSSQVIALTTDQIKALRTANVASLLPRRQISQHGRKMADCQIGLPLVQQASGVSRGKWHHAQRDPWRTACDSLNQRGHELSGGRICRRQHKGAVRNGGIKNTGGK